LKYLTIIVLLEIIHYAIKIVKRVFWRDSAGLMMLIDHSSIVLLVMHRTVVAHS